MADLDDYQLPGLSAAPEVWEAAFAPYDEATYQAALARLQPADVVLDIGAGDLRFARRAAGRVRRIIAIERRWELLTGGPPRPANLDVICGDARRLAFPAGVTVGVLLMRHCRHFAEYAERLRAAGAQRLITNARWGMDVEEVRLGEPRLSFAAAAGGWYACQCGAVGFAPGPADAADGERVVEVQACPACRPAAAEGR